MAKFIRLIPCLNALIDKESNAASYLFVIENIQVTEEDPEFPPILMGMLWQRERDSEITKVRLQIESPSGKTQQTSQFKIEFKQYKRFRLNVRVPTFNVEEEGIYLVHVQHQDKKKKWITDHTLELDVLMSQKTSLSDGQ